MALALSAASQGGAQAPVTVPPAGAVLTVTHQARSLRPGEAVLITIESDRPLASLDVDAFGQAAAAFTAGSETRWQVLAGIDVEAAPGPATVTFDACTIDGVRSTLTKRLVVEGRKFGTRRLKVAPKFVSPPRDALVRIQREQERLAALFVKVTRPRAWRGAFVAPVEGRAADNFGQLSVFNGVPWSRHRGTDFSSPAGTPVGAPNTGVVVLAEDLYYTGNTVVLDHGCGLFSLLAHLSRIDVALDDSVERSQVVGAVGATGRVTGPHLHWTARIGTAAVDPMSLLAGTWETTSSLLSRAWRSEGSMRVISSRPAPGPPLSAWN